MLNLALIASCADPGADVVAPDEDLTGLLEVVVCVSVNVITGGEGGGGVGKEGSGARGVGGVIAGVGDTDGVALEAEVMGLPHVEANGVEGPLSSSHFGKN